MIWPQSAMQLSHCKTKWPFLLTVKEEEKKRQNEEETQMKFKNKQKMWEAYINYKS